MQPHLGCVAVSQPLKEERKPRHAEMQNMQDVLARRASSTKFNVLRASWAAAKRRWNCRRRRCRHAAECHRRAHAARGWDGASGGLGLLAAQAFDLGVQKHAAQRDGGACTHTREEGGAHVQLAVHKQGPPPNCWKHSKSPRMHGWPAEAVRKSNRGQLGVHCLLT